MLVATVRQLQDVTPSGFSSPAERVPVDHLTRGFSTRRAVDLRRRSERELLESIGQGMTDIVENHLHQRCSDHLALLSGIIAPRWGIMPHDFTRHRINP
ncbi:hypothetical protein [Pseudomonas graminis]|uniref:hypothetical protein n=1 Tax=Pseudomonas graminis TaxID=158627 RepID=UPI00114D0484|nr:hypothetical protein [Pseudomonas graminis]